MCLWDAFLWEPAPALGFARMQWMDIAYMQTSFGFASQLRTLGLHSCCHNAAGTEAQMHLRFAFSAISEDPLHIGNYKLAANYGCFRADQRIHFYNVCFSAACCGGNVHLWETAWLPGVIWLQGMEIAHVQISFVVDRGLFTSELRLLRLSCLLPLCCGTWESDRCIYGLLLQHMPAGTQHIGNHKLGANDGCSANS